MSKLSKKILCSAALLMSSAIASAATFTYSGPIVAIPDKGPAVEAPIAVSGLPGVVGNVVVTIGGTNCASLATVGIDHTYTGDLQISLRGPDGTVLVIVDRVGSSGDNFCRLILDDSSVASIQSSVSAPFTGTYSPANPLSTFKGKPIDGEWTLVVQDLASADIGNVRAWSIDITPAVASAPAPVPAVGIPALIFGALSVFGAAGVLSRRRRSA